MRVIIKEKKALKEVVTKMTYFLLQDDEGYYSSHYQVLVPEMYIVIKIFKVKRQALK